MVMPWISRLTEATGADCCLHTGPGPILKPERPCHRLPHNLVVSLESLELFYFDTFQVGVICGKCLVLFFFFFFKFLE